MQVTVTAFYLCATFSAHLIGSGGVRKRNVDPLIIHNSFDIGSDVEAGIKAMKHLCRISMRVNSSDEKQSFLHAIN